jgi:hypothetical protein
MKFTAKRYRPENAKHDRIYVSTTERFRKWMDATNVFRAFSLINDNEMAHECNHAAPSSSSNDDWTFEFEIKLVIND